MLAKKKKKKRRMLNKMKNESWAWWYIPVIPEPGRITNSSPSWTTWWVPCQPGLFFELCL
jgi:hypothetical protein